RVPLLHHPLLHHLRHPAASSDDQLGQIHIPFLQLIARNSDVGDLDDAGSNLQPVALFQMLKVDPASCEIFADVAITDLHTVIAQALVEFFAVNADGAIWPAVVFAVFLPVALDTIDADHRLWDWLLGHAAAGDVKLCELADRFGHD